MPWLAALGAVVGVLVVVPPVATLARAHDVAQALQFAVLALAVPALVAVGAPWHAVGLGASAARAEQRRLERAGPWTGVVPLVVEVAAVVAWRTPAAVGGLQHHRWLLAVEAVSLVAAGLWLWLDLVASPPLSARPSPLRRLALATLAAWSLWIVAYVAGMGHGGYPGFVHATGGLSAEADRQLATALLFAAGALAYLPVVFVNLFSWLRAEDRAGEEDTSGRLRSGVVGVRPEDARPAR